jgi:hypothetical protein
MRRDSWKCALILACTTAGLAVVASAAPAAEEPVADRQEVRVPVAGVQVAIDPETGRLRQPTRQEARELLRGLDAMWHSTARSGQATKSADGTLSMVLGSEGLNIAIARLDGIGLASACVENAGQAEQFLLGAAAWEGK